MEPKMSIIVPVYNVEKYLRKCIESILNQTFKDFELILVNDGSLDKCGEICDEYVKKDKRIKVIHKNNGGQSSARNAALDIAQGDYIGFVDSDDWIDPDMYETLYNLIIKSKKDIANISFTKVFKNKKEIFSSHQEILLEKMTAMEELINHKLYGNYFWANLFKSSLIKQFRFKEGIIFEDVDLMYRIFDKSNGIITIGAPKYNYLQRENSTINTYKKNKNIDFHLIKNERREFLEKHYFTIYKKNKTMLYNEDEFWSIYDLLLLILKDTSLESKKKLEKLIKIINNLFYKNIKLKIPIQIKIYLLILKINSRGFQKLMWRKIESRD